MDIKNIKTSWLSWDEIAPYREQLIDLELRLMIDYHYPERNIPRSFIEKKVQELETHLANGNTYFWAATDGDILAGYYWAYTALFIDKTRWILHSLMFRKEYRNLGLGALAIQEGLKKAAGIGCDEAATEYAAFNHAAARLYEKAGYKVSRIEVVRKIEK